MNDLEPWKIWAVTGVLVCVILSGTGARIRPLGAGEAAAQANVLTSDRRAASTVSHQAQSSDQHESYFSGYFHSAYSAREYSQPQTPPIIRVQDLMVGFSASSGVFNDSIDNGQAPELNVTQQILGTDDTQADQFAANSYQPFNYSGKNWSTAPDFPIADYAEISNEMSIDQLNSATAPDGTQYTVVLKISSPDGNGFTTINLSGAGEVRISNMALIGDQIKVAFSNVTGSSDVTSNVLQSIDAAVSTIGGQSQVLDGEPQNGPASSIGAEDLDELRAQAVEADVLARSGALSEVQQRSAAINARNSTYYYRFTGIKQE